MKPVLSTALPGLVLLALAACGQSPRAAEPAAAPVVATEADLLARGEFLVRVGQCNDCHTPGYAQQQGNVPDSQWLTGNAHAFLGPWGTTYPSNLRLTVPTRDEAQWLAYTAGLHTRPPMPDYTLRALPEDDRRAIYRFIRSLGPAGNPAPEYLPPGQPPQPPYMELVLPPLPADGPAPG